MAGPGGMMPLDQGGAPAPPISSGLGSSKSNGFNWLGLVNPGLGVLGNIVGGIGSYFSQRATNRANQRMMREQNAFEERMWNLQNEYNTPANQMKRLLNAGLNPDLMYQNGTMGNSAEQAHATYTPQMQSTRFASPFQNVDFQGSLQSAELFQKQKEMLDVQIEKQEIENKIESKNLSFQDERRFEEKRNAQDLHDNFVAHIDSVKSKIRTDEFTRREISNRIRVLQSEYKCNEQEALLKGIEYEFRSKTFQNRVDQVAANLKLTKEQAWYYAEMAKNLAYENLYESLLEPHYSQFANTESSLDLYKFNAAYLMDRAKSQPYLEGAGASYYDGLNAVGTFFDTLLNFFSGAGSMAKGASVFFGRSKGKGKSAPANGYSLSL